MTAKAWLVVGTVWVLFSGLYLAEAFDRKPPADIDFSCELPGADSAWGSSTWQAWPPGTVCHDLNGRVFSRPDASDGAVIILLAVGSVAFVTAGGVALSRRVRRSEPALERVA